MNSSKRWLSRKCEMLSFWPLKLKKLLFWKKVFCFSCKIQNFENFQKTGIYVKELVVFNHHGKFQTDLSIFGPPSLILVLQHYTKLPRHIQKRDFREFYFYLTYRKKLMAPLGSWAHSASETCNFFPCFKISKFDLFDLTLSFVFDKIKLNGIFAVILEFYVEIGP